MMKIEIHKIGTCRNLINKGIDIDDDLLRRLFVPIEYILQGVAESGNENEE